MERVGLQAIGLWSQSKSVITGSDQSIKEEFIRQATTTKGKCIGSNGRGSPNHGERAMKNT